jgi:perosamine synthetase
MITLRDHGQAPYAVGQFWNIEVAYKYKMSAMQAAMGRVQLQRIDELVGRKREIFRWYEERLGGQEGLELNHEPPGVHNVYWMTTVVPDERFGVPKGELAEALAREGVTTRPFFWPLSALPAYSSTPGAAEAHARNRVAARLGDYGVNLPSALKLQEADIDYVCEALLKILQART